MVHRQIVKCSNPKCKAAPLYREYYDACGDKCTGHLVCGNHESVTLYARVDIRMREQKRNLARE